MEGTPWEVLLPARPAEGCGEAAAELNQEPGELNQELGEPGWAVAGGGEEEGLN